MEIEISRPVTLVLCLLALPAAARSAPPGARPVEARRALSPPTIDGRVEKAEWEGAAVLSGFVQQQPRENEPSTELTEVRVLYDDERLYLAVICFDDDPGRIVVTQSRRDGDLTDTDSIQIVLDTYDDDQSAFLFGTNPLGVEYDGQIAAEGATGGALGGVGTGFGGGGSQRGQLAGFNRNWDGDWSVEASITERGWEAELAIPFKTLRYQNAREPVWGLNVMRNIRRKNEQSFLAPVPRVYNIYRVSLAADLVGLHPPRRRDLRAIPYGVAATNEDRTSGERARSESLTGGLDVKWGVTPNATADFTVNTDFSQVEADEEQVNLTRFDLFFPEKRSFFLENAATFQFGEPQAVDLFFSRRIGLTPSGEPIGILAGARLSGQAGPYQLGFLNMQTETTLDAAGGLVAPANNYTVARVKREVFARSDVGAIFVNRFATGSYAGASAENRAYGADANLALSENGKLFAFLARSDTPGGVGSDYSGRALYDYRNNAWNLRAGYTQVGDRFDAEVGFVPRVGFRRPELRVELTPQADGISWIRRFSPHALVQRFYGLDGRLQTALGHYDFEVNLENGGQTGVLLERRSDRPDEPFTIFQDRRGSRVVIPPGLYTWNEWLLYFQSNPSAPVFVDSIYGFGSFYDGRFHRVSLDSGFRVGARFLAAFGLLRNDIDLPSRSFVSNLVRVKATYSFDTHTLVQALVQYNNQSQLVSANVRFAWLNRSGTGLFVVFNERRDVLVPGTEPVGRSFIVKYTHYFEL
jgi:Domain of unknown function (DUF5916)/Carbohydrate family 9 binding domain-like